MDTITFKADKNWITWKSNAYDTPMIVLILTDSLNFKICIKINLKLVQSSFTRHRSNKSSS